jgi:hypothetical protein
MEKVEDSPKNLAKYHGMASMLMPWAKCDIAFALNSK